jgi:hypothetical protein
MSGIQIFPPIAPAGKHGYETKFIQPAGNGLQLT